MPAFYKATPNWTGYRKDLEIWRILVEERNGCRKGTRGTNDILFIEAKTKQQQQKQINLALAWINFKKTYIVKKKKLDNWFST